MTTLINLMNKPVRIIADDGNIVEFPACKNPPRLKIESVREGTVETDYCTFPVRTMRVVGVDNMPDSEDGIIYIVNGFLADAMPHRFDLFTPASASWHKPTEKWGEIYATAGLVQNPFEQEPF